MCVTFHRRWWPWWYVILHVMWPHVLRLPMFAPPPPSHTSGLRSASDLHAWFRRRRQGRCVAAIYAVPHPLCFRHLHSDARLTRCGMLRAAGAGGNITIEAADPALLFLVEVDVRGGRGGAEGPGGASGSGGSGGAPGRTYRRFGAGHKHYKGAAGQNGSSGRSGLPGNHGPKGAIGSASFAIVEADGKVIAAPDRYDVQVCEYEVVDTAPEAVFEPGTTVLLSNITCVAQRPTPTPLLTPTLAACRAAHSSPV